MGLVMWDALSVERSGPYSVVAGHRQSSISWSGFRGTHEHYLPVFYREKERERQREREGEEKVIRYCIGGGGRENIGLEGSQVVPTSPSGRGKAYDQH
jgi:hypothetical protein